MQVFLSWSGDRSGGVAKLLLGWLPHVIQALEPCISTEIEKGRRWSSEIAATLASAPVSIVCLTRDNLSAPWLLFEARALSRSQDTRVCTFLLDLQPSDVAQPLAQFQHTTSEKSDVWRLVQTLNTQLRDHKERFLSDSALEHAFQTNWEELETQLRLLRGTAPRSEQPVRTPDEILAEILGIVRRLARDSMARPLALPELPPPRRRVAFVYTIAGNGLRDAADTHRFDQKLAELPGYVAAIPGPEDRLRVVFLRPSETAIMSLAAECGVESARLSGESFTDEDAEPENRRLRS